MQINNIFSSFVAIDTLHNIDNETIIDYIFDLKSKRSKSEEQKQSNKLGWQSENLDISLPIFNTLFNEINKRTQETHNAIGLKENLENKLDTAWVNVNTNGGYNVQHKHMNACFSGTYYLRGVESGAEGDIVFKNTNEAEDLFEKLTTDIPALKEFMDKWENKKKVIPKFKRPLKIGKNGEQKNS